AAGVLPDVLEDGVAVLLGHLEIEDDEVELEALLLGELDRGRAVGRLEELDRPEPLERGLLDLPHDARVVGEEDPHGRRPRRRRRHPRACAPPWPAPSRARTSRARRRTAAPRTL